MELCSRKVMLKENEMDQCLVLPMVVLMDDYLVSLMLMVTLMVSLKEGGLAQMMDRR